MQYEGRLFRPPSEARSLIIQTTLGCPHNKCSFCSMYQGEEFRIVPFDHIKKQLVEASKAYTWVDKVFLADGDSLFMKTDDLLQILDLCYRLFPNLRQVNTYASTRSILNKSPQELKKLKGHGLEKIYLGIESGSDRVLQKINKGVSQADAIEAGKRIKEAGLTLSITFISGLGSRELSKEHAIESAKVINEVEPDFTGVLTLLLEETAPLYKDLIEGRFIYLEPDEVLREVRTMIKNINVQSGKFSMAHVSNYINIDGEFPDDKDRLLAQINYALDHISNSEFKTKWRGL